MGRPGRLGLIVNPWAGIGGPVGLKGSDGAETLERARRLGGEPSSPARAVQTLRALGTAGGVDVVTYPAEMGAHEAEAAGVGYSVIGSITEGVTTAADTIRAARDLGEARVDLLAFVGGDGTARDVLEAVGTDLAVIGVPAGVKMHSSVFAVTPRRAAEVISAFLEGRTGTRPGEVMDIDEDLVRAGRLSAELHGYLRVPDQPRLVQGPKSPSRRGAGASGIARRVVDEMDRHTCYILGPGTTVQAITDVLGLGKTLLGVDAVYRGRLVGRDMTESELVELASAYRCKIVVGAVGGQGYVLGRGNQQISPVVIRGVGPDNIVILATPDKLVSLGGPLRVDTGDPECDRTLAGYRRVVTGPHHESVVKVEA